MNNCPHCGMIHQMTCPRIRAIDYYQDGSVKRIEFHPPAPAISFSEPVPIPMMIPNGPANTRAAQS
jgi:hypothetical protein